MSEDRNESRQAEIMSKQDLQGVRTPADVERKHNFGKKFSEVYEIADGARETAEAAKKIAEEAGGNLTKEEIFNILTDDGTWQGIYRDNNGNVYINASYIRSGTYTATGKITILPGMSEYNAIMDYLSGGTAIAYNKLSLYDFDGDGEVTQGDAEIARQCAMGERGTCDGLVETDVTVTIDPSAPESFIRASGLDMWGNRFDRSIGLDSVAKADISRGGSISWYDEISDQMMFVNPPMQFGQEYYTADMVYGEHLRKKMMSDGSDPESGAKLFVKADSENTWKSPLEYAIASKGYVGGIKLGNFLEGYPDGTVDVVPTATTGGETYTEVLHLEYGDFSEWDEENYINYTPTFYLSHKIGSIESCTWEYSENYDYILDATWYVSDDGGIYFKGYFDDYVGNGVDVTVTYNTPVVEKGISGTEEGTIDGWTYIKYPSGICECWKTFTNVAFETKVSWGNGYLSSQNGSTHQHWFSLPSGLLTSGDVAHIDLGTPGYVMMACFTNVSSAGVTCYIWSPTSYDGSTPIGKVCISVKGRWK